MEPATFDLDGYRATELLYDGSRSQVVRAVRLRDGLAVVVKVPTAPSALTAERTRREFELGNAITGPVAVRYLSVEPYGAGLALVMEDTGATSLQSEIPEGGIGLRRFFDVAIELVDRIAQLHALEILHLDIKPSNVLLDPGGATLRLCDFDLSRRTDEAAFLSVPRFEGTLAYISPEQTGRTQRPVDHRSDFYSLGVTLFQLLTGALPFHADDPMEYVHAHLAKRAPSALERRADTPPAVDGLLQRLLAKSPGERYVGARGIRADLERCRRALAASGSIPDFALGEQDVSAKLLVPDRFYGRRAEADALLAAFERAAAGPAELVLVRGFSGIGKSALVEQLHRPVLARRGAFATGKYDQLTRNVPYSAIFAAVRGIIREILTEDEATLDQWKARLQASVGVNGQLLVDVIPELGVVIGPQPPLVALGPAEAQARFRWIAIDFIAALASAEHPTVLFLDDLQWADDASFALLDALLSSSTVRHLLVLGAYRDNEVDAAHRLTATRTTIEKVRAITDIALGPIERADVSALVGDALRLPAVAVEGLAAMLFAKTDGNPFFLREFLKAIAEERLLAFDAALDRWTWDLDAIAAKGFTDNVVDLMVASIRKLPEYAQSVLSTAAAIGARFSLDTLAAVARAEPAHVAEQLREVVRRGLIVPEAERLNAVDRLDARGASFHFLHDRVQQAAWSLVPEGRRPGLHLEVGRLLLKLTDRSDRGGNTFEVVRHLNEGLDLIDDATERATLCALNREAGRNATAANAYRAALSYFATAWRLLGDDPWRDRYRDALDVRHEYAQAAYLAGDYETMTPVIDEILERATTVLDKIPTYRVLMAAQTARNLLTETIATALSVLGMLGTSFPSKPGKLHVGLGLAQTKWRLRGHTRASLLALPRTDDPAVKARIEILVGAITPSFLAAPDLMPLLCFEALRLSLAHGNCRHSIHAYATWSLILIVALGDVAGAEMFDGVARQFVADFDATDMRSRVQLIHSVFIDHLRRPIVETADGLLEGHRVGVAMGDLETAALHVNGYHWTLVYGGARLDEIARSFDALMDPVRRCDVQHCIEEMILGRQFIRNLMDEAEDSRKLTGPDIEEDAFLALQIKANLRSEVALVGFLQGWLALLHGEPVHAHARFAFGAAYLDALAGTIAVPEYLFLQGVARSQAHASLPVGERAANLRGLASNLRALKRPAGLAPRNHQHKVDLLLAERARLQGDHPGAMAAFARGLKGAHDSGLVHEEALGHELAARFYLSIDQTVAARGHVREARDRYEAWGCTLKVRLLDREFDALLPRRLAAPATRASAPTESAAHRASLSGRPPHESSRNDEVGMLDLATLFKSSRVMIEEIVLDTLLGELLRMLLENAGAERGFLLLAEDDSLRVALEIAADGTKRTERRGAAVTDDLGLSTAIVQYVARTRESVVLNDAAGEGLFTRDPYVEAQKPRSVLCAPLVKRGRLEAVVYMENNLSAGAFTRDRLDVINLLTAQAALSIHNARLYDDLQRSLADQVKLAKAQARFVPNEFLEGLARRSIVDVALGEHVRREMSIVFSDIKGFTSLVEGMRPEEHIAFINEYLSYMEPAVLDHGGFVDSYIGDAIMALFQGGADGAVRAGIAMHEGLGRYNAARALRGEAAVGMGVGVNTGLLTMGTIGGPQHIKCGVIGDAVNLAARVESLTRRWSSRLLITHFTRERLADATPYGLREIGRVTVVGKSTPVTLFEVLAAESPVVRDARLATLDRYGEGLESFYARRFDAAARCFEACASGADDPPAAMFLARSLALAREGVPDDWVGVEVLSNK